MTRYILSLHMHRKQYLRLDTHSAGLDTSRYTTRYIQMTRSRYAQETVSRYTPLQSSSSFCIHCAYNQDRVPQAGYTLRYTQSSGTAWIASVPSLSSLCPPPKIKCAKYTQIWHNFEENNEFYCLPIDSSSDSLWNLHMIGYDLGFCYINCKNHINCLN